MSLTVFLAQGSGQGHVLHSQVLGGPVALRAQMEAHADPRRAVTRTLKSWNPVPPQGQHSHCACTPSRGRHSYMHPLLSDSPSLMEKLTRLQDPISTCLCCLFSHSL